MVGIALALIVVAFWGMTRVPTAFIPIEDQGYLMVNVQLPDGASLSARTACSKGWARSPGIRPASTR